MPASTSRTLRELYLAPFEAIVREAGVWSVMASYNGVNGEPMTDSWLLEDILHTELGFDGVVMSDWFATRSTEASARAALDLVMPGPNGPWGDALLAAVGAGMVEVAAIDDKVLRILRAAARVGALDGTPPSIPPTYDDDEIAAMLRRIAAAGFVLARNDRGLLPLDASGLERLAVIGPNAALARTLGGGSATVLPPYTVSPLEGLRSALAPAPAPGVQITYSPGVQASNRIPVAPASWVHVPGARASPESSSGASAPTARCSPAHAGAAVPSNGSARSASPGRSPGSRSARSSAPPTPARTRSEHRGSAATC